MGKFPSYTPGTFYVMNCTGSKMAGGKDFATVELAIEAAKSSIRRSLSNARAHGTGAFDVMECIPGNHKTRATVNPDLSVVGFDAWAMMD